MIISRAHQIIQNHISVQEKILQDDVLLATLEGVVQVGIQTFQQDGKILFCGNGGSAADAQHIAAELSGRFYINRPPLFAEALHVNSSFFTAVCNDYSFEDVYARAVEAMGKTGDTLFCISTSGNSENVIRAAKKGRDLGMTVVGMTGESGGKLKAYCDHLLNIPSTDTPRIQEGHILLGHIICELVEEALFFARS
ncbi:MAG: D-sedoheptulose 7-phosphate isomerase [Bacteroidota bacterium]